MMKNRQQGFTLMEVILAITIISFVMVATYATLFTTINARDEMEKESLQAKIGPAIMDMIERDIHGAWSMNIHKNDVFFGENHSPNGVPADRFHLITTTDSTIVEQSDDQPVHSDLTEVSYLIRQNPQMPDLMELYRRQDFHVDEKIAEGGIYELIYSRIRSFRVLYFKNLYEGSEEFEEWDAKVRNCLPAAMEVSLSLEIDPRLAGYALPDMERPTQDFRRIIFFPMGSELTMATRPVIPTYVEPESDAPQGGGASGFGAGAKGGGKVGDGNSDGMNADNGKGGMAGKKGDHNMGGGTVLNPDLGGPNKPNPGDIPDEFEDPDFWDKFFDQLGK